MVLYYQDSWINPALSFVSVSNKEDLEKFVSEEDPKTTSAAYHLLSLRLLKPISLLFSAANDLLSRPRPRPLCNAAQRLPSLPFCEAGSPIRAQARPISVAPIST
ncbi:hypothetical protein MRB53_004594 [Persea americana]|uniref:Uncharacterized protein n=1 Tax=Persea americana TaxID=3435 RepID=A0ACC2MBT7_PERAE|nr:hypothetical protein MRB53_004594 [Persea americana]